jgi:photosystem II stability/assembly factor-like uncharacterized protein
MMRRRTCLRLLFVTGGLVSLNACSPTALLAKPTVTPLPSLPPLPTETPTATVVPFQTSTPFPAATPIPTATPVPTATPAPYNAAWQDISPPVSLDSNKPPDNFGLMAVTVDPKTPTTVYVGSCYQGLWKSTDSGSHWAKVNTGRNGDILDGARLWTLAIDPVEPNILYTAAGYGHGGVYKSTNGGVDWDDVLLPDVAQRYSNDVFSININPNNRLQLMIGFHSFPQGHPYVVLMTGDGGASWQALGEDVPWGGGEGHQGYFLSESKYLVLTPSAGFWLSIDAGKTWKQVSTTNSAQYDQLYIAPDGALYTGWTNGVVVSRDAGVTWQAMNLGAQSYQAVIGLDGFLFTASGNNGQPGGIQYSVSPVGNGKQWSAQSAQHLTSGPNRLAADPTHHVLYSSNGNAGVWKLALHH